ncbi:hypothetical protein PG990_011349 [Apiospora arundinis]
MAILMFALFLLAFLQHALALKPYGGLPPYPLPYGNSNSTMQPTATGHHRPLVSTTGTPNLHNDTSQSFTLAFSEHPKYLETTKQSVLIDTALPSFSYSPDCIYAGKWSPHTFVQCLSDSEAVRGKVKYTMQHRGRKGGINWLTSSVLTPMEVRPRERDKNHQVGQKQSSTMFTKAPVTWLGPLLAYNYVIDGWSRRIMQLHGFTMSFFYTSWDSNNCHDVVRDAIKIATCPGVSVANGLACRKKGYYGDNSLPSGSPTYNHPDIDDYDDNDAGPP